MNNLTRLLTLLSTLTLTKAIGWIGQTLSSSSQGNSVNICSLNSDGSIADILSSIPIQQEMIRTDQFRCVPDGSYCQFATYDMNGNSYLYNLSDTSGTEIQRTPLPSISVRSLHVNLFTGISYGSAITNNGRGAIIFQVNNGVFSTVMDLSTYLIPGQTILDGGATHCSNINAMWINFYGVENSKTNGTVLTVALNNRTVTNVRSLQFPGFSGSLWAYCNDASGQDIVGGNVFTPSTRTLTYGTIDRQGQFIGGPTVQLPVANPAWVPNGLLSMADGYDYFAGIYPQGTTPSSKTAGNLALFNENDNTMTLRPISYNLVGAARYQ